MTGPEPISSVGTNWATYSRGAARPERLRSDDGVVYHTYSAYARGLDGLWGLPTSGSTGAPLGRNESGYLVATTRRVRLGLSGLAGRSHVAIPPGRGMERKELALFLRRAFFVPADATTLGDDHEDNPVQPELP